MQNGLLTISWENVKSAAVSTVLVALGATLIYVIGVGDVFKLNWHMIINTAILAGAGSLVKNFFTTNDGKFMNTIQTN